MRLLSVVGNRPQFIKSAPLSVALREAEIDEIVVHTGQHYDPKLSQVFFDELGLSEPDHRLGLQTADPEAMRPRIHEVVRAARPDAVLVYGDTNSTLAGAQAAAGAHVPVAHVEAGLRSGDLTMPEERNRIEVDRLSQLLFAPDERSRDTLAREHVPGHVEVVGDVMRDSLDVFAPIARKRKHAATAPYALLTIHRAANTEPERLRKIVAAVNGIDCHVLFPVHPRTRHVLEAHGIELSPTVTASAPLGYLELLAELQRVRRVVTDSGGLQ